MFKKYTLVFLILGISLIGFSQEMTGNLNDYKYVTVPKKYDFLKEADTYQLNSLTKFLFEKYGFVAFMEGEEMPDDFKKNVCLALDANVLEDKGLFKTKLMVELKDCQGKIVFTTKMGETREKEFKKAYQAALRDAFTSFEGINYQYVPNNKFDSEMTKAESSNQEEIEKLKAEIEQLKETKVQETNTAVVAGEVGIATTEVSSNKEKEAHIEISKDVLYAQATDDGYQLVDSSPKIVYKLKKTGSNSVFLVESINGVLTKKGNDWVLEYYDNGNLIQKTLNIKF